MLTFIAVVIVGIVLFRAGLGRSPWLGKHYVGYGERKQNGNDIK
jgi:hypothetical protein